MDFNGFSLESTVRLRAEAFKAIRTKSADIAMLASAVESLDAALRMAIDARSVDESQELVSAARRLSSLLDAAAEGGDA